MKKNLLGYVSGAALAIGVGVMSGTPAQALIVNVTGRGTYDLEVYTVSDNAAEWNLGDDGILAQQDWWGDQSFARDVLAAWKGTARGDFSQEGGPFDGIYNPSVAYGNGYIAGDWQLAFGRPGVSDVSFCDVCRYTQDNNGAQFLIAKTDVTPVPTPAAVLPGLFGMGLSALRKRRVASSEEA